MTVKSVTRRSDLLPRAAGAAAVRRVLGAAGSGSRSAGDPGSRAAGGLTATVASAALRALAAAVAGFALTAGLALVLWAMTPSSGSDAGGAVRSGAVAFASAHFLPVTISGTALTLRPLLLTGVMVAVMMTAVGHARAVRGRALEAVHAGVFTIVYALGVGSLVAVAAPAGSAQAGFIAPAAVAALGAVLSLAQGATDWRAWWISVVPPWLRQAARAAAVTVLALVSASAAVLAAALAVSLPDALGIAQLTVHSVGDALGVVLLCLAFVPNAVIAAIGYVSGAGFSVGAAGFSPLAVHAADLPAVPLLAAAPHGQPGVAAWATLLVPVIAALAGARTLRRAGASRWQRLAAVGLTAIAVGAVTAGLAAAGGGGVAGGNWSHMGAEPFLSGGLLAGVVLVVTGSVVVPPGWASLGWRSRSSDENSRGDGDEYDAIRGVPAGAPAPEADATADAIADVEDGVMAGAAAAPEDGVMVGEVAAPEDGVITVPDLAQDEPPVADATPDGDATPDAAARDAQPEDPLVDDAATQAVAGDGEGGELAQAG